jgi:hypothetical protein
MWIRTLDFVQLFYEDYDFEPTPLSMPPPSRSQAKLST